MKIEKSNNPAAIGALILVLVLIVGRIAWMLLGRTQAASAASTSAAPPAVAKSTASLSSVVPVTTVASAPLLAQTKMVQAPSPLTHVATRNPFASNSPVQPAHITSRTALDAANHDAIPSQNIGAMPLPPLHAWAGKAGTDQVSSVQPLRVQPMPIEKIIPTQVSLVVADPAQPLKLTAIVDGTTPMAIVQTAQPEPVVLHIGDDLEGMRVIAIHDDNMVFARGRGQWTLHLQSAVDAGVPGSLSVSSMTVSEEKTNEVQ